MSTFAQYALQEFRFPVRNPDEYLQANEISCLRHPSGIFAVKCYYNTLGIKNALISTLNSVPLITSGPQPNIMTQYNIIQQFATRLVADVQELDKVMPDNYKCTSTVSNIINAISQFAQYIPTLVSVSAPTLINLIPNFQEILNNTCAYLDQILMVFHAYPAIFTSFVSPVNEADENSRLAASLIHATEILIIDLTKMRCDDRIAKNEAVLDSIGKWLNPLNALGASINQLIGTQGSEIANRIITISTIYPGLMDLYTSINSAAPDLPFFTEAVQNAIAFMQFCLQIEYASASVLALQATSLVANASINNDVSALVEAVTPIITILQIREKETLYGALPQEAIAVIKSLPAMNKADIHGTIYNCIIALALFASSCATRYNLNQILRNLIKECFDVAKTNCKDIKQNAVEIATLVGTNEIVFDTKKLSYMNYYLKIALDTQVSDDINIEEVRNFLIASIALIDKIELLLEETDVADQFTEVIEKLRVDARILSLYALSGSLCYSILVITKGDIVSALSTYAAGLANVQSPSGPVNIALQGVPRVLRVDITLTFRVQAALNSVAGAVQELLKKPEAACIAVALKSLADEGGMPYSLEKAIEMDDIGSFMGTIEQCTGMLDLSIADCEKVLSKTPQLFVNTFSTVFSLTLFMSSIVEMKTQIAGPIGAYPPTIKGYIDVMWPTALEVAMNPSADASSLSVYLGTLKKPVQEMKTALLSMPQPSLVYEVSESLKQIRALQSANNQLPMQLKTRGQMVITAGASENAILPYITPWFQAAQNPVPIGKSVDAVLNDIIYALSGKTSQTFLTNVEILMVSMANNAIPELTKPLDEEFNQYLEEITALITKPDLVVSTYYRFLSTTMKVKNLNRFSKVRFVEAPAYVSAAIISSAHHFGLLSKELNFNNILSTYEALSIYNAISALYPKTTADANKFKEYTVRCGEIKSREEAGKIEIEICKIFKTYVHDAFKLGEVNGDKLVDALYDFFADIRFNINTIFTSMNNEPMEGFTAAAVRMYISNAASLIYLVQHGVKENPEKFISGVVEITNSLPNILHCSLGQKSEKTDITLRRSNRNIAKQIDIFINSIETPKKGKQLNGFQQLKHKMLVSLEPIVVECMRKVFSAITSLHPTMENESSSQFAGKERTFDAAFEAVNAKATGKTKKPFVEQYNQLKTSIKAFQNTKCDFRLPFPAAPVIEAVGHLGTVITRFAKMTEIASDILIIDPDPIAAKNVPNYIPDFMGSQSLTPQDALADVKTANTALTKSMNKFKEVLSNNMASSDQILEESSALIKGVDPMIKASVIMATSTSNKNIQIQIQASTRDLAQSLNDVLYSTKNRLLRKGAFLKEMDEAQTQLMTISKELVNLAEASNKAAIEEEKAAELAAQRGEPVYASQDLGDEGDQVSNELMATASAIAEMSSRLAAFSEKLTVNVQVEEFDEEFQEEEDNDDDDVDNNQVIDLKTEEGTMASYIIGCATPIMATAAEILQESQKICMELKGMLSNEAFIIKCAQDVSESAELLLCAAEIAINGKEKDPECVAIAASNLIKAAIAGLVAQVSQTGSQRGADLLKKGASVRFYCQKIVSKVEVIAKQKWRDANKPKAARNKLVMKMNATAKLNNYEKDLEEAERRRNRLRKGKK